MGRDLYDISWLLGQARPDYSYLDAKVGIRDEGHLRQTVLDKLATLDTAALRTDVLPFLPSPVEANRITLFADLIRKAPL